MAMGQPASAEPYLLRMHALLAAHDLPVHRAEALLARVAQSRINKPCVVEIHAVEEVGARELRSDTQAPASNPPIEDSEVAETFALELPRDLLATLPSSALGFTVEYGFTGYEEQSSSRLESCIGAELELTDLPAALSEPDLAIEIFDPLPATAEGYTLELHSPRERATFLQPPARRSSPRGVAVVMPSPSAGVPVQTGCSDTDGEVEKIDDETAPKNTLVVQDEQLRERRPFGAALRAGRATAPKSSHGVMIAGIVIVTLGGAAAWVYMHGGF